ncbi:hypothetical protein DFH07DRAFT_744596, partial [Mycena maculata]
MDTIDNHLRSSWLVELASTPDAVLSNSRSGAQEKYDVTGFQPSWMLKVTIKGGILQNFHQIPYSEKVERVGYTALSYWVES